MFRWLLSQLVEEIGANVLLHRFLWTSRGRLVVGPGRDQLPGLYSGQLQSFFSPEPRPVDLTADREVVDRDSVRTVWDCRFPSETVTAWPECNQMICRHWEAQSGKCGLTVVGVDGIVQLGPNWFARLAAALNPRGIDVVMMDSPGNFRRTPKGFLPGQLIVGGDLAHQLAMTRHAVLDLWRVIRSVQSRGQCVGLVGISYGGWLTLLASLLADDLDFLIAVAPPADLVHMLREPTTVVRAIRRGLGLTPIDSRELERIAAPVLPMHWTPRLPGSRIILHAARYDRLVSCRDIERLADCWKTRLVEHKETHFRATTGPEMPGVVAQEVLELAANVEQVS